MEDKVSKTGEQRSPQRIDRSTQHPDIKVDRNPARRQNRRREKKKKKIERSRMCPNTRWTKPEPVVGKITQMPEADKGNTGTPDEAEWNACKEP
jgi:transcription initiation factor TFIID subunit TAF12